MPRSLLSLAFLSLLVAGEADAQAPQEAAVFAPGVISIEGSNIFRGAFSPDGEEFWFFRKVTEGAEDYRIFVSRREDGAWGEPERVDLGGDFSDLYPSISADGGRMVFASYRPAPADTSQHPNAHLWYVDQRPDGTWGTPVFMAAPSTLANYDSNPRFRPDGAIEFASTTPDWSTTNRFVTHWDGTRYGPAEPHPLSDAWAEWRDDVAIWSATLSPDGELAILEVSRLDSGGRRGPGDLWFSRREGDGWSEPHPLGAGVNSESVENFVVFAPDGSELYFVRGFERYWWVSIDAATGG